MTFAILAIVLTESLQRKVPVNTSTHFSKTTVTDNQWLIATELEKQTKKPLAGKYFVSFVREQKLQKERKKKKKGKGAKE